MKSVESAFSVIFYFQNLCFFKTNFIINSYLGIWGSTPDWIDKDRRKLTEQGSRTSFNNTHFALSEHHLHFKTDQMFGTFCVYTAENSVLFSAIFILVEPAFFLPKRRFTEIQKKCKTILKLYKCCVKELKNFQLLFLFSFYFIL